MILNIEDIEDQRALQTTVCIIGAGAAGLTIASELEAAGIDTIVLESGRLTGDADTQALYRTTVDGLNYPTAASRLRLFGGTTYHWTGWSRPMDAIDLETRSYRPGSNWPITRKQLTEHLPKAIRLLELGNSDFGLEGWHSHLTATHTGLQFPNSDALRSGTWQLSAPTRFTEVYQEHFRKARHVRVILGANATKVEVNDQAVAQLTAGSLTKRTLKVMARHYILCAGGIENARLLLALDGQNGRQLGNIHDQTGRYFADHLILNDVCTVYPLRRDLELFTEEVPTTMQRLAPPLSDSVRLPRNPVKLTPWMGIKEQVQRQLRLPNATVRLTAPKPAGEVTQELRNVIQQHASTVKPANRYPTDRLPLAMQMVMIGELTPSPENRVTLTREQDALGMPVANLTFRASQQDMADYGRLAELVGRELTRTGFARVSPVRVPDATRLSDANMWFGFHHTCTTRMSASPRTGVVDSNCRVHGMKNLHVAGSSVFASLSSATPTLNLTMLALRLAQEIKAQVRKT